MRHFVVVLLGVLLVAGVARGMTIVLPAVVTDEEMQAAEDLAHVWMKGTGEMPAVVSEGEEGGNGPWFVVGETWLGRELAALPEGIDGDGFRVLVLGGVPGRVGHPSLPQNAGGVVILRGASGLGTEFAADWFAQHEMGVRWFRSGELGEVVPNLRGWRAEPLDRVVEPGFVSRQVGSLGAEDKDWGRRNGMNDRLPHAHALLHVFPRELFDTHPEWFPRLRGQIAATRLTGGKERGQAALGAAGGASSTSRNLTPSDDADSDLTPYRPKSDGDYNWQPNLALPEAAKHAAEVAGDFFDRHPEEQAFSLSENDSDRFDESDATVRARGPLRWFRGKPDYSDLVFGFMNRAADEVRPGHPDKLLAAYAYYWCENTPSFPVRPNVLPWLTADRSEYFDPDFEREDHALIERWCHSGARVVGIYDYVEGMPYLIPRQTARMTADSIKFAYAAGVRAYTAEGSPNWGLDGPKLWVAAQLLWDPNQQVEALLEEYYSGYWREAAPAMRQFDELCEKTWREQPRPAEWIKYYQDESQAELFPAGVCQELRAKLDEAEKAAKDPVVKKRVEVVSAGFGMTEHFCAFCSARNALSGAAVEGEAAVSDARLAELLEDYRKKRAEFLGAYERAVALGGVTRMDLNPYLRNDPGTLAEARGKVGERAGCVDQEWRTLKQPEELDDRSFEWASGPWWGHGQPAEGRSIGVRSDAEGRVVLRFEHCRVDSMTQWVRSVPGGHYRAEVDFRGKVSPGDQVFLVMNCLDGKGRYAGQEVINQVPSGDWSGGRKLAVVKVAPANAAQIGLSVYVMRQMPGDWAEFSGLRVERW